MPVQSKDPNQIQSLRAHLDSAAALSQERLRRLRRLARQLDGYSVLPLVGAGGSYDCGTRLTTQIAVDLYDEYRADSSYSRRPGDARVRKKDLGAVADAMFLEQQRQDKVVEALGLGDAACWPSINGIDEHFCGYRVLARLAREDLFTEALTFNYDCGFEAGLRDEGFQFAPSALRGRRWLDHATVIADPASNANLERRGAVVVVKAHGCAARYREAAEKRPEDRIIVRWSQLLDWRTDLWARDVLADRARRHVLLLVGFSGQDPVVHVALTRVLEEVYKATPGDRPRVVVVDRRPNNLTLRMLVNAGLAKNPAQRGEVTRVSTFGSTITASLLVLLAELLAGRLEREGLPVADDVSTRLAELIVAAPAMLRWSFLLRPPMPLVEHSQRINLKQAAANGYVPLSANPDATIAALRARRRLRGVLGRPPEELLDEVLDGHGFVLEPARGTAYLPVGLTRQQLVVGARGAELDEARRVLARPDPARLDSVLVVDTGAGLTGVSVDTGNEVAVP